MARCHALDVCQDIRQNRGEAGQRAWYFVRCRNLDCSRGVLHSSFHCGGVGLTNSSSCGGPRWEIRRSLLSLRARDDLILRLKCKLCLKCISLNVAIGQGAMEAGLAPRIRVLWRVDDLCVLSSESDGHCSAARVWRPLDRSNARREQQTLLAWLIDLHSIIKKRLRDLAQSAETYLGTYRHPRDVES